MRSRRKKDRFGTLLFVIPTVLIAAVVAYAVVAGTGSPNGTLIVDAQSSARYYPPRGLNATVDVGSQSGITPLTLTLTQGAYTVAYLPLQWYTSPAPKNVTVIAGRTSYAVGTYAPIVDVVSVGQSGFNSTRVTAMSDVTPVVWLNPTTDYVIISSNLTGRVIIPPMQNITRIFQRAGTYEFSMPLTPTQDLIVNVA